MSNLHRPTGFDSSHQISSLIYSRVDFRQNSHNLKMSLPHSPFIFFPFYGIKRLG